MFFSALPLYMWIAVIIVLLFLIAANRWNMTWVSVADKKYHVRKVSNVDPKESAEMLHKLTKNMTRFVEEASDKYPMDERLQNLKERWNGTLSEVGSGDDIAYSLNKKSIHICIRNKDGRLEKMNTAMYVLLHEAAHVASEKYGHGDEFWRNFRWLLEVAEDLGMYTYQDFDNAEVTFCGKTLGNNVMKCVKERTCDSQLNMTT